MVEALALPLLLGLVLYAGAGRLGAALPPATAVRLLTLAALVAAASTGFVLAVVGFSFLAQHPEIAELGHWSAGTLRLIDPVSAAIGLPAAAGFAVLLGLALSRSWRVAADLHAAAAAARRLGPGRLVVVADERPDAYAVPGLPGRVVVSTGMLAALPAAERRALLAHEASHLNRGHHGYLLLTEVAAAANPLLRPAAAAVRTAVERWADEDAAQEVGDRRLVARAVARAGLVRGGAGPALAATLGASGGPLAARATALLGPPPPARRLLAGAVAALVLAGAAGSGFAARAAETRFEQAAAAYQADRPA